MPCPQVDPRSNWVVRPRPRPELERHRAQHAGGPRDEMEFRGHEGFQLVDGGGRSSKTQPRRCASYADPVLEVEELGIECAESLHHPPPVPLALIEHLTAEGPGGIGSFGRFCRRTSDMSGAAEQERRGQESAPSTLWDPPVRRYGPSKLPPDLAARNVTFDPKTGIREPVDSS